MNEADTRQHLLNVRAGIDPQASDSIEALLDGFANIWKRALRWHEYDEVAQSMRLALVDVSRTYDDTRPAKHYVCAALSRRLYNVGQSEQHYRRSRNLTSLDQVRSSDSDEELTLGDLMAARDHGEIPRDQIVELLETIRAYLTELEFGVVSLFALGRSYVEITEHLGIDEKSVDNALKRARDKFIRLLANPPQDGSLDDLIYRGRSRKSDPNSTRAGRRSVWTN